MSSADKYRIPSNNVETCVHINNKFELYEKLLNQVQDVSWICDIDKKTGVMNQFYTSPSCVNVYEVTADKIKEDVNNIFECITPKSRKSLNNEIEKSVRTSTPGRSHGNYLTPNTKILKKHKWCWSTENINGCVRCYGTTTDVTKEFEIITSKLAQEVAEVENKKKKNFLERTCHEQRNLHMGVSGGSEVAIDYIEKLETQVTEIQRELTKLKEVLNIIADSSEHINHLLDTTLSLQQMESEHFSYTYNFHSIHQTIDSCTKQLSHMIKSSIINLNISIDSNFNELLLRYDNIKVIQAIMNYLSNAYKYTKEGTIKLNVNHEDKSEDIVTLEIQVKDMGIGIKDEYKNQLFQLYKQVDNSYGGSGIGLYLVKKYIEEHNGSVGFDSEIGKGSCFWLRIPCQYKLKETKPSKNNKSYHTSLKIGYKDILLVEDMNSNRVLIGTMLMNLGYQYDECSNGIEALEKLKSVKYGIILTDRKMPKLDGLELTKQILKDNPNQMVIGVTGNSIKEQIDEWIKIGLKGVITKPCSKIKLQSMLDNYIHPICSAGSGI